MSWIINEYRRAFWFYLICSLLVGIFAPWATVWWVTALINFLGAYFWLTIYVVARVIWTTIKKKKTVDDPGS